MIQYIKSTHLSNKLIRVIIPIVVFAFFILSISYKMLPSGGIVDYVDTVYFFADGFFNSFSTWVASFSGSYNANMFGIPITGNFPRILNFFGIADNYASYILNYAPVLILCLLVFFISKKISNNIFYAYFAGFFIILNNFILQQFFIWPGHYFYNVIGLVLLFYQTYRIYIGKDNLGLREAFSLILISFLAFHPFFFVMYLVYLFLFFTFYSLKTKENKTKFFSAVLFVFIGVIFIHLYWIIPFVLNRFFQSIVESYNGNLIPVLKGYISIANYSNLINYLNYPIASFSLLGKHIWQYLFYFVYFGLIIGVVYKMGGRSGIMKKNEGGFLLFVLSVYVVFFALALGPNEKILGGIWMYFFDNIPFFGFFRSFTRFLIVSLVSTIFIFAIFIKEWAVSQNHKKIVIALMATLLFSTNAIFFSGNLNGAITTIKIPQEYFDINERYFKSDSVNFSFVSLPTVPYEAYTWSENENIDLFNTNTYFSLFFFSKPVIYNDFTTQIQRRVKFFEGVFSFDFKPYENFDRDLSKLNAKYILLHKDLINTIDRGKAIKYDKYLSRLENNPRYSLREENDYFYLYEFNDFTPILSADNLSFYRVFDTKYKLIIHNLKTKTDLSFLTSFHEGWNLYLTKDFSDDRCRHLPVKNYIYEGKDITECSNERKPFMGEELSYLWRKPIFSDTHSVVYDYANQWTIDSEYIRQNFDSNYYRENPDGSIDVQMILYFKPQSYFYLGLFISGVTLLSCLGYLSWNLIRRYKQGKLTNKVIEEIYVK